MRRAIIVVLACSLLLPAGLLATSAAADPVDVPVLEGPARVDRDANGIAHIRAGSRHDLFFLRGGSTPRTGCSRPTSPASPLTAAWLTNDTFTWEQATP